VAVEVGQEAPDFTLKDQRGQEVSLSSLLEDASVVLAFYPLAFSGTCTTQLTAIGGNLARYAGEDGRVVGISVDSHYVQRAFAASLGLEGVVMLADFEPKGEVARRYGVYLDERGYSNRASFVIDRGGVVRAAEVMAVTRDVPDEETLIAALSACRTRA
jgi:peroxiredoxin (alkyl hydroperoxide reductase subunit C)